MGHKRKVNSVSNLLEKTNMQRNKLNLQMTHKELEKKYGQSLWKSEDSLAGSFGEGLIQEKTFELTLRG